MKQKCLEQVALQERGTWREQRCETWNLQDVAVPGGRRAAGGTWRSGSTEHGTWRTWHCGGSVPIGSSAVGNGAHREWRSGGTTPGESIATGRSTCGEQCCREPRCWGGVPGERGRMAAGNRTAVCNGEMGRALRVVVPMGVRASGGNWRM